MIVIPVRGIVRRINGCQFPGQRLDHPIFQSLLDLVAG